MAIGIQTELVPDPQNPAGLSLDLEIMAKMMARAGFRVEVFFPSFYSDAVYEVPGYPQIYGTNGNRGIRMMHTIQNAVLGNRIQALMVMDRWSLQYECRIFENYLDIGSLIPLLWRVENMGTFEWLEEKGLLVDLAESVVNFFVASNAILDEALRCGLNGDKVLVIPPAIDTRIFKPVNEERKAALRQKYGFGIGELIFIHAGRLVRHKGTPQLLEIWPFLETEQKRRLVIAGGPMEDIRNYSRLLNSYASSDTCPITYMGPNPLKAIAELMQLSDFGLFPTLRKGFAG